MSFVPTDFRPFARGGWGGKPANHFRNALSIGGDKLAGGPFVPPETIAADYQWGQIGTVLFKMPGGFSNSALTGISRNNSGAVLGNCSIELYAGKRLVAMTTSDGSGNYTFLNPGSGPFRVIATKAGVAGVSDETLLPAIV